MPIAIGCNVILKGGRKRKRRFNGYPAQVLKYPRLGSWMTVKVCSADNSNEQPDSPVVKWRKRGYEVPSRVATTTNSRLRLRLQDLNNDVLAHVFGFVKHGSVDEDDPANQHGRLLRLKKAARLHTLIASISRSFRRFANQNLDRVLGHLEANFDALKEAFVIPCVLWLCKYKLRLGRIKMRFNIADIPLFCRMLHECDTDRVLYVEAYDAIRDHLRFTHSDLAESLDRSNLIAKAWSSRFGEPAVVVDLTTDASPRSVEEMASDLEIPFRAANRKELHDTIANYCPNLVHLRVDVKIAPLMSTVDWRRIYFSTSLFTMPSIRHLQISLSANDFDSPWGKRIDSRCINSFIRGLGQLEELEIGFGRRFHEELDRQQCFRIESPTLRSLNVENMRKGVWVSCTCPHLERYICNGSPWGNGTRPDFTFEQFNSVMTHHDNGDTLVVRAGESVELPGLEVPNGCECIFNDFSHVDFQHLNLDLQNVRNAWLWTERNDLDLANHATTSEVSEPW